jgi:hypothetical protein
MRKAFSWFFTCYFILGSLAPNTDFAQFWHTAFAFEHFSKHQEEANQKGEFCSVWTFLKDHYLDPDNHVHEDGADHENLPIHHLHPGIDLAIQPSQLNSLICQLPGIVIPIGFVDKQYSYLFHTGIDHPPSTS